MSIFRTETNPSIEAAAPRRQRVLILETDRLIKALIIEWLHMAGNDTVCASDAAAAARLPGKYDLVLADVPAPLKVARNTVASLTRAVPGTPIVAMSADIVASGEAASRALARELGAAAVLVKPFTKDALLHAIHRASA